MRRTRGRFCAFCATCALVGGISSVKAVPPCTALLSASCHDAGYAAGRRLFRVWIQSVSPEGAQDDRRVAGTTKPSKPRCPSRRVIRGVDGRSTCEQATPTRPENALKDGLEEHQRRHRGQALLGHVSTVVRSHTASFLTPLLPWNLSAAHPPLLAGSTLPSRRGRSRTDASRTSSPWAQNPSRLTIPRPASATSASASRTSTMPTSSSTFPSPVASSTTRLTPAELCSCTAFKACRVVPPSLPPIVRFRCYSAPFAFY